MGQTAEELRYELADQRASVGRDLTAIGDRLSPGRAISRRRAAMRESMSSLRDRVMGVADSAADAVGDVAGSARSAVTDAPDALRTRTEGAPLAVGLLAFSGGFAVASLLPTTKVEERSAERLQPALESMAREVGHGAHELASDVRDDVETAGQQVAERAKDTAAEVASSARETAQETMQQDRPPSTF